MPRTVAIGIQDFSTLIERKCFYIDKTSFIKEWWENEDNTTLITRPRRFGKTLNMSMLETFFSVDYAGRGDLFEGLVIWEEEKYRQLQGTYPVISLSFADVKETDYEGVRDKICRIIQELYIKFEAIKNSGVLGDTDIDFFDRIIYGKYSNADMTSSIKYLSKFLYNYYGKKVIILLDEYDTPMQEAYVNGFWDEIVGFTRSLFNSTFKSNTFLERAIMTGITRVSKQSIFSDLNHLEVVTTTSKKYATTFGFTEDEVFAALDEFGLSDKKEDVKSWYDGFIFGDHSDIYNPWSIINYLDKSVLSVYWANTSSNGLVSKLLMEGAPERKEKFETLLRGDSIKVPVDEHIVYDQLDEDEGAVWSLLLASGYLKVLDYQIEGEIELNELPLYELTITNNETKRMFNAMVKGWFRRVGSKYNEFIKYLLLDDKKAMNEYMKRIVRDVFSYFDTGGDEPERFYHGFTLGLLVEMQSDYIVTSNRESGFGRYDVMLEPRDITKKGIILEFKIHDNEDEETLKDTVAAALKQIEDKQYAAGLVARGIKEENIRKYGIAFKGKEVLIG